MPRRKAAIEEQPYEATTYEPVVTIDESLIERRIAAMKSEEPVPVSVRLEQLAQEIGQLFSGGAKTWLVRRGNVTIKVKVWEVA